MLHSSTLGKSMPSKTRSKPKEPITEIPSVTLIFEADGEKVPLILIKDDGNLLLDVKFQTSQDCIKSIPKETLKLLRNQKAALPEPRIIFRVKLESLTEISAYFRLLLGPSFAEGIATQKTLEELIASHLNPAQVDADKLPRVTIVDEDLATKTIGRENVFTDLLRVVHGLSPITTLFTLQYMTVLVLMADNYDVVPSIARYFRKIPSINSYRITPDKAGEEILRQKILILYFLDKGARFTSATSDLIMRGSVLMNSMENNASDAKGAWWDLPYGIESEIAYRRACVLRTIASIQNQYLKLYTSPNLQCKLGYDSSSSCDSFQLGEMIKFLSKKGLLFLISFKPTFPDELDNYRWPKAYTDHINDLIGVLRQCPSYQLDRNHKHCGLRCQLLPALDFITKCIDTNIGVKLIHKKGSSPELYFDSWKPSSVDQKVKSVWVVADGKKIDCVSDNSKEVFQFQFHKSKMAWGVEAIEARTLFTASSWNWVTEPEIDIDRLGKAFGAIK